MFPYPSETQRIGKLIEVEDSEPLQSRIWNQKNLDGEIQNAVRETGVAKGAWFAFPSCQE
jgi:hypothetical protein